MRLGRPSRRAGALEAAALGLTIGYAAVQLRFLYDWLRVPEAPSPQAPDIGDWTVVIAARNEAECIERAVASVRAQAAEDPKLAAYAMSKAALRMLARNLVLELGPHGITLNTLAPGATLTERTRTEQADYAAVWSELVPRGQIAVPDDIANACLFLLSEASAHVNGQTLVVDGGWSATSPLPEEAASEQVLTPEKIGAEDNGSNGRT